MGKVTGNVAVREHIEITGNQSGPVGYFFTVTPVKPVSTFPLDWGNKSGCSIV